MDPTSWACFLPWDRRPFVYDKSAADDAGHHAAVRLDHTSEDTWRVLLREGDIGFRGVDVVRAWF
jgi:hypothetical protein